MAIPVLVSHCGRAGSNRSKLIPGFTGKRFLLSLVFCCLTITCIIGENGASSRLFAFCVFSRTGVGAKRPGRPGTQGTVLWARHVTNGRHGQDGIAAELPLHIFSCMYTSKAHKENSTSKCCCTDKTTLWEQCPVTKTGNTVGNEESVLVFNFNCIWI